MTAVLGSPARTGPTPPPSRRRLPRRGRPIVADGLAAAAGLGLGITAYEASPQSALDEAGYTAPDGSKASTDVSNIEESGGFGH